jgi:hypothetical protein
MENRVEGKDENSKKVSFKMGLFLLMLNVLVSTTTVYVYDRYFVQKVVAFDIRGYMADQKKLFYAGRITEDELLKSLDKLDDFLRLESRNTLILNGDAVIKNAKFIKP